MKTTRKAAVFAGALLAAASAWGQANTVIITRTEQFVQTGPNSGTDLNPVSATPFYFTAAIEGLSSGTGTLTLPDGTTTYSLTSTGSRLLYTSGNFASAGALTTAFPDSADTATPPTAPFYTVATPGGAQTAALGLSSDSGSLNAPFVTLTGGGWAGGTYVFNPANTVTISFNLISGASGNFHYNADVNGAGLGGAGPSNFIAGSTAPMTFNLQDIGTPIAGNTYTIEVGYDYIQFYNPDAFGDSSNVTGAGLYEYRTTVNLMAVPEPASTAALLGGLALAAALWRRRKPDLAPAAQP
ncbi:MAG: PEP-CTERM sorting domain-containing protein [Verrucomicrobia bacterium]|nr:PEP-CTERM sorting domain-containing protein [Verrucomicrobiota bacterium]